jgi:ketosteroid isomerase-like protein
MSQENVEIVRRFFEAVERSFAGYWENPRPLAAALEAGELWPEAAEVYGYLHPEAKWKMAFARLTARGHLEMARGWDQLLEVTEHYMVTLRGVEDLGGDQALATVDRAAKAKQTGIEMSAPLFSVITVRDGLIVRMDEFSGRAEALEAAGLSE